MRRRKQEKKEGKGARANLERFYPKKKTNKKTNKSKFWLLHVHQSGILCIVTRNLYQNVAAMRKSASIANFGQN